MHWIKLIFEKFLNINNFLCENRHSWSLKRQFTSRRNQKVHWNNNKKSCESLSFVFNIIITQRGDGDYLNISLRLLHSWWKIINIFPIDDRNIFLVRNVFIGGLQVFKGVWPVWEIRNLDLRGNSVKLCAQNYDWYLCLSFNNRVSSGWL